jgi:cell division transport system ATP-binding protein
VIRFKNVSKKYSTGSDALRLVNLDIGEGEFVFLTGHSGAGKTTMLRLLALLDEPTRGQLVVAGQDLGRLRRSQIPYYRRRVGIILQQPYLLPDRTVGENVELPLKVADLGQRERRKRVRAALDKVSLLDKESRPAASLSVGEQQRAAVARAVVNRPFLLLADEPTGNLDPTLVRGMLSLFEQFNQVGVTVVVATHDTGLLNAKACRTLELSHGTLLPVAPSGAVLRRP